MANGRSKRSRGHNLLEVLLATMIFATVLIPMAVVFQYIAISTGKTRAKLMGQYLAKGTIEKCLAAKYYNVLELRSDTFGGPMHYDPIEMTIVKDGSPITYQYFPEVDVNNATGAWVGSSLNARVIRVRVYWDEKNRNTNATRPYVEYSSYIGENS